MKVKEGNKWVLYSHSGKKLYESTKEADVDKREKQIKYFKWKKGKK